MKSFAELSPLSRVWVYQSNRELTDKEVSEIQLLAAAFVTNWTAHGSLLMASADVFYNRFLIIAADENQVLASGCSIDKSVGLVKDIEKHFNINLLDRLNIAYWEDNKLKTFAFADLEKMYNQGTIKEETLIFNNLVKTLQDLKNHWKIELKDSWMAGRLPVERHNG